MEDGEGRPRRRSRRRGLLDPGWGASEKVSAFPTRLSHPDPESLAQRRGGVIDLAMGVGRANALIHEFFGGGWGREVGDRRPRICQITVSIDPDSDPDSDNDPTQNSFPPASPKPFVPSCETIPGTTRCGRAGCLTRSHEGTKPWPPKQHITFQIFAEGSVSAGAWLSRPGVSHRGHRVHGEILPFAIDKTAATSPGLLSDGKGLAPL
jgi:hypothetical protein